MRLSSEKYSIFSFITRDYNAKKMHLLFSCSSMHNHSKTQGYIALYTRLSTQIQIISLNKSYY